MDRICSRSKTPCQRSACQRKKMTHLSGLGVRNEISVFSLVPSLNVCSCFIERPLRKLNETLHRARVRPIYAGAGAGRSGGTIEGEGTNGVVALKTCDELPLLRWFGVAWRCCSQVLAHELASCMHTTTRAQFTAQPTSWKAKTSSPTSVGRLAAAAAEGRGCALRGGRALCAGVFCLWAAAAAVELQQLHTGRGWGFEVLGASAEYLPLLEVFWTSGVGTILGPIPGLSSLMLFP